MNACIGFTNLTGADPGGGGLGAGPPFVPRCRFLTLGPKLDLLLDPPPLFQKSCIRPVTAEVVGLGLPM